MRKGLQGPLQLQNPRAKPQGMIKFFEGVFGIFTSFDHNNAGCEAPPVPVLQEGELCAAGPLPVAFVEVRSQVAKHDIQAIKWFSACTDKICQRSQRIGCVIPHYNLQRGITQPILRLF